MATTFRVGSTEGVPSRSQEEAFTPPEISGSAWGTPHSPLNTEMHRFIPPVFQQSLARGQAIPTAVEQPFPWVRLLLVFLLSFLFTIDKSAQYSLWSGISMLRSKGSPVTSPNSKAPGTSHQDQRSFLKNANWISFLKMKLHLLPEPICFLLFALPHPLPASSSLTSDKQTPSTGTKQMP